MLVAPVLTIVPVHMYVQAPEPPLEPEPPPEPEPLLEAETQGAKLPAVQVPVQEEGQGPGLQRLPEQSE
jgi:hypothetical protein